MNISTRFGLSLMIAAATLCAEGQAAKDASRSNIPFAQRFFAESGGTSNGYCFPGKLFDLDSSIKDHPSELCGSSFFVAVGYRITRTWSVSVRRTSQDGVGPGAWRRTTGNPAEDAYNAVAKGETQLDNPSLALIFQKEFMVRKWITPYCEFGGGPKTTGSVNVAFHGVVTATDPSSGAVFQMPESDTVRQHIPIFIFGGGVHLRLIRGIEFGPGWEWNTGYSRPLRPLVTLRIIPFGIFAKEKTRAERHPAQTDRQ